MKSLLPLLVVIALASAYGFWYQRSRGTVKAKSGESLITEAMIGGALGSRATLVQFSSAFCTPCRATRVLLENIVSGIDDVYYVEVDAEASLDLVRSLNILSTPTTLILNSRGMEVGRAIGAPKREQVMAALAAIRK
ncbi:unannotated protein [freshwater metagenome]|uniref:Unannotated protein n=1 Tax=freshwater metagenome TaxID=449393 RepID=A0A6J6GEI1_9ZZZZ|nr:hypothetical protein [Actinomycetota bacterium]